MKRESFLLLSVLFAPVLSQESPSKVQGVTVTRTVQGSFPALRVSWIAVSGSGITYTVCYSTASGTRSDPPSGANCGTSGITGRSTTLGPLSGGTTYYIWVRAVSSGRRGPYSDRGRLRSCNVPSRLTLLGVFYQLYPPFEVGISVSWRAPQSDCPITSYEVQYKISSDTSWSTPPVSTSSRSRRHDWRGLSPNTSYDVRVRAVSAAGKGAWSDVGQATTPGGPGPVRSLSATPIAVNGVPALHIRWSPPVDKAGGGLTYRLRVVPPHVTISRPVRATEYIGTGLRANTSYTVYVRAGSSGVYGPEVSTVGTTGGRTDFSAVSPTLIRKFTFPSRLAVVFLWSVPASVADDVDGFEISVVMMTPSGPNTIQRSTAGTRVRAYGVYFPEKGASYQVTVHMTMNGLHSRPLTVEVNFRI